MHACSLAYTWWDMASTWLSKHNLQINKDMIRKFMLASMALLLSILSSTQVWAQSRYLDVVSFEEKSNSTDARIAAPEKDANGQLCALIKLTTDLEKEQRMGLNFVAQGLEIVKIIHVDGDIWIYVPDGSRAIEVTHEDYRNISYDYPIAIKGGTVYSMMMRGVEETQAKVSNNMQAIRLEVKNPRNAAIYINGDSVPTLDGIYFSTRKKGTYQYRITAPKYRTQEGEIELGEESYDRNFSLVPLFTNVTVRTMPEDGADVYIEEKAIGQTTPLLQYEVDSKYKEGTRYKIRVEKKNYLARDTTIEVFPGCQPLDFTLNMISTAEVRRTLIMADVAFAPHLISYGLMVGMTKENGGYVHARTNLKSTGSDMTCDDTGMLTSGGTGIPYYREGVSRRSHLSFTAGYMRRILKPLFGYVGAGYGMRNLTWETMDGKVVKNQDHSSNGVAAELGAIGRFGKLALSVGYQTIMFKYHEASLGVGVFF